MAIYVIVSNGLNIFEPRRHEATEKNKGETPHLSGSSGKGFLFNRYLTNTILWQFKSKIGISCIGHGKLEQNRCCYDRFLQ